MEDIFNLDFESPEELENEEVLERNLYNKLISDGFIFTEIANGTGAAYIMPDGKFLFLEQNRKFFKTNKITHGALDFYLIEKGYVEQTEASRILCQTDNAIRINDGSNFAFEVLVGLPKYKLTYEQEEALENWLYNNISKKKYFVSVGNELVSEVFQRYNLQEQLPEDVIKKIKNYYNNGILREAKDIKNKMVICPKCNKELLVPILHVDGFGYCSNVYKCECGELVEVKHLVDEDKSVLIYPASKELADIINER